MNYHIFNPNLDKENWENPCPKCGAKPTYKDFPDKGLCLCKKCGLEKQLVGFDKALEWATEHGYIL